MMPELEIYFVWNDRRYAVSLRAYSTNCIRLPDGTILGVGNWFETYPPQPQGLYPIPPLGSTHTDADQTAFLNTSESAREIV
jgi:hypothetical protein